MISGRLPSSCALVALAALLPTLLTGCSLAGLVFGSIADEAAGKGTANRLVTVRPGTSVTMWLTDGSRLHGRFLGSRDSISEAPPSVRSSGVKRTAGALHAVILLGTDRGVRQVPIDDVSRVSVPVKRGTVIGLVSGVVMDGLILLAVARSSTMYHY